MGWDERPDQTERDGRRRDVNGRKERGTAPRDERRPFTPPTSSPLPPGPFPSGPVPPEEERM